MPISGDLYEFSHENIAGSPNSAGVYALYESKSLIYIGKSTISIRDRLSDHKSGRDGYCTQAAHQYRREVSSRATARERELLQEYLNSYGRLPKCNDVTP